MDVEDDTAIMDVEDDTAIMEDEDDDKSVFLYVLENLPPEYILYHKENFDRFECNDYQKNMYYKDIEYWQRSWKGLKGMDLDDVKHYPFNELAIFTDDIHKQYTFETNFNGRFLRGSIKVDSDDKNIIIKTWDLHYPPRRRMRLHVVRLHNELTFLMDALKRKPHSCLPKLIGYSIDKRLAVIYDIKTDLTLRKLLDTCDDFSWKKRLDSAIEVAKMMCYFHEDDITIGSIDSLNLIFDEDGVLKLCDFGLTVKKKIIDEDHDPCDYVTGKHYKYHSEKLYFENGDGWTLCSDIFAFGFLLLELILFSTRLPSEYMEMKVLPSNETMPDNFGRVDTSIIEDVELGVNLRELAWKCMQENPSNRPKAKECYDALITFMDKADPVDVISSSNIQDSVNILEIGKTSNGESQGLAGDRIPGRELSTNLPDNTPDLEKYVMEQGMQTYSLDTYICLLRRYQGEPKVDHKIVGRILVKALMAKPAQDFRRCLNLIPKKMQKEKLIKTLIALSDFLEAAKFPEFWDKARTIDYFLKQEPGFEQAIRAYAIHILSRTYRRFSTSVLAEAINMEGPALATIIEQQVRKSGWVIETSNTEGQVIVIPSRVQPSRA